MTDLIELSVPGEGESGRLDRFLQARLTSFSRSFLARMIETGRITVDGLAAKPATRLRGGEMIRFEVPKPDRESVEAEPIPLDVIHEDEHILVLNKPAGLVVHPGAGRRNGTLVNALLSHCCSLPRAGSPLRPGIVHRLDKDTSGVMVVAKTDTAMTSLVAQFSSRGVLKIYTAVVWGEVRRSSGTIDVPVGRSESDRKKISTRTRKPREAVTHYDVIERFDGFTLLRLRLGTGRTHQIRVHLSHAGHPVVGDRTYGGEAAGKHLAVGPEACEGVVSMERQALHATRLGFTHPGTGRGIEFEAKLPPDIERLLVSLTRKA